MPLDIAKFGRKPYDRLEKPGKKSTSRVHLARYFSSMVRRALFFALCGFLFFIPAFVFDWNFGEGVGRVLFFRASSCLVVLMLTLYLVFDKKSFLIEFSRRPAIFVLVVFWLVVLSSSSFFSEDLMRSLGFSSDFLKISLVDFVFLLFWFIALFFIPKATVEIKTFLVSWFLGSAVFTLYSLFLFYFKGGYETLFFIAENGFLLALAVNSFLLLAFAIFQKGLSKIIWTSVLFLHLLVLFIFDLHWAWIVLLIGILSILVFQIIYSKKLWQKNFTYPLQICVVVFLLLIVPVKVFTGKSVPQPGFFSSTEVFDYVRSSGFSFLGKGLSMADDYVWFNSISTQSAEDGKIYSSSEKTIKNGFESFYISSGFFGVAFFLLLGILFLFSGFSFLKRSLSLVKESDMSEDDYLGLIFLIAFFLLFFGFWFSPFSFFVILFLFILKSGGLFIFDAKDRAESEYSKNSEAWLSLSLKNGFLILLFVFCSSALYFYFSLLSSSAYLTAKAAEASSDNFFKAQEYEKASQKFQWNSEYKIKYAFYSSFVGIEDKSTEEQKKYLEEISQIIKQETNEKKNPIAHWYGAVIYKNLENYLDGANSLSRDHYLKALELWPKNLALPVSLSKFYRENLNQLVSAGFSSVQLLGEARDSLRRATEIEPNYLPAQLELAFIYGEEEGPDSAISELLKFENSSPEIEYYIGRMYFKKSDFEKSAEKFKSVIEKVPNHSNARYSLAVCYFKLGRYKDSLLEFEEVLRLNPENEDVIEKIKQVKESVVD